MFPFDFCKKMSDIFGLKVRRMYYGSIDREQKRFVLAR